MDCVHLAPIGGVNIEFSNNGVAVTATTNAQGVYDISVPPLSGDETWEVILTQPAYGYGFWEGDPSGLSVNERYTLSTNFKELARYRGESGGGGDKAQDFAMYPGRLTEKEQMEAQNAWRELHQNNQ
jgi:hypothetical protein